MGEAFDLNTVDFIFKLVKKSLKETYKRAMQEVMIGLIKDEEIQMVAQLRTPNT